MHRQDDKVARPRQLKIPHEPPSPLEQAKSAITIFDLWLHFGYRGNPHENPCRSPFRRDFNPSFSVGADGKLFHDFATGQGGAVVQFVMLATGLSKSNACKWLIQFHRRQPQAIALAPRPLPTTESRGPKPLCDLRLPTLDSGTDAQFQQLAQLRGLSVAGLRLASSRGFLGFTDLESQPALVVTDATNYNAQARMLSGGNWPSTDRKVKGFVGNCGSWPIGIREAKPFPGLLVVEGTPDLLAGFDVIAGAGLEFLVAPVCVTGASNSIHSDAMPSFRDKRVFIVPHRDAPGQVGAARWRDQLLRFAASVRMLQLPAATSPEGEPLNDLNDFVAARHPWIAELVRELQASEVAQ